MNKTILLSDYYPVYKDIYEITENKPALDKLENEFCNHDDYNSENKTSGASESIAEFTVDSLVFLCNKYGYSAFSTLILLLKNAFEGHAYLFFNIRPDQLFEEGIYKVKDKEELLVSSFFEHLDLYWPGFDNGWKQLCDREENLHNVCIASLLYYALANQLFRLPVSLYATTDTFQFSILSNKNPEIIRCQFDLIMIGERAFGEYLFVYGVNNAYEDKFRDQLRLLRLKEDVLMHYDRKLFFAHDLNVRTEQELDSLMYTYLVESKLNSGVSEQTQTDQSDKVIPGESKLVKWIRYEIKSLYYSISRNCSEVLNISDSESKYPELYQVFMEAKLIRNEHISDFHKALLRCMRMVQLYSQVLIYRKTHDLNVFERPQNEPEQDNKRLVISETDFMSIRKKIDVKLATYRMNSCTEAKINYISDEYMIEIHKDCLQKQIEFIDQKIMDIQQEIRNILKQRSENL